MSVTEKLHAGGFILSEANGSLSRDNGTLITGQNLIAGTVLGKITVAGGTSAAKGGGNTGGGTCTPDVTTPVLAGALPGIYTIRCVGIVANGGVFAVYDPNDKFIGIAYAGVAFAHQIKFVLADSGTDFAINDGFDFTVAAGSGKYTQMSLTALDGSQAPAGVLLGATDATSADKAIAIVARQAELNSNELTWPDTIPDATKAAALVTMKAVGLVSR